VAASQVNTWSIMAIDGDGSKSCPQCQANDIGPAATEDLEAANISTEFQAVKPQKCLQCGHIWEPPAPKWLLGIGLFLGSLCIAASFFWLYMEKSKIEVAVFGSIGIMVICGCVRRFLKSGKDDI
jgi:hypothetical protein